MKPVVMQQTCGIRLNIMKEKKKNYGLMPWKMDPLSNSVTMQITRKLLGKGLPSSGSSNVKRGRKPIYITTPSGLTVCNTDLKYQSEENSKVCVEWIERNFEEGDFNDPPLLREFVYNLYERYCDASNCPKINSAYFGKCLRKVFPELRSRRLIVSEIGLKYYYVGVRIKSPSMMVTS